MNRSAPLVAVAMSGGVDSSVAAALLVEQGYPVVGITLQLWKETSENTNVDTPSSTSLAEQVAGKLGIPFHCLDAQEIFKKRVVGYFLDSHRQGMTPNPCIFCNRQVKWGYLLDYAHSLGAQYLATGHYARLSEDESGRIQLWKGKDAQKDQSYFLCRLTQDQLSHTIFPLGEYTKSEVRNIAHQMNLEVAERKESQDLCFLGDISPDEFLLKYAPELSQPGPIINSQGVQIGEHLGLPFYTIGQRKGIKIASQQPYYVLKKDIARNALVVGYKDELGTSALDLIDVNWIAGMPPSGKFRTQVKIRYRTTPSWAEIQPCEGRRAHVSFDSPLRDITPGQIAVFYDGEIVLGGGMIL